MRPSGYVRIAASGLRAAPGRFVLAVAGVASATMLALGALAIGPALEAQDARAHLRSEPVADPSGRPEPLLWFPVRNPEPFGGKSLTTVFVAAAGPGSPRPLGADRVPKPREVLASPAVLRFLASEEGRAFRTRLPGEIVGVLGKEILHDPDEFVMMVGTDAAVLETKASTGLLRLSTVPTVARPQIGATTDVRGRLLSVVVALAMSIPVLVFVRVSTQVSAGRRAERLAAVRLIGGSPAHVRVLAGGEAVLLAGAGVALGALGALGLRWWLAPHFSVGGTPFFASDLRFEWAHLAGVAVVAVLVAVGGAVLGSRDAAHRPLFARRIPLETPNGRPGAVSLGLGFALLLAAATVYAGDESSVAAGVVGGGLACTVFGLLLVAPWALRRAASAMEPRVQRPAWLLAAARVAARPRTVSRSLAGVVGGVFTVAMAGIYFPSHLAWAERSDDDGATGSTSLSVRPDVFVQPQPRTAEGLIGALARVDGVHDVLPVIDVAGARLGDQAVVASCAQVRNLVEQPVDCANPSPPELRLLFPPVSSVIDPSRSDQRERGGAVSTIFLNTDGRVETAEAVRRLVLVDFPGAYVAAKADPNVGGESRSARDLQKTQLAVAFILVVAAATYVLAVTDGVLQRRRLFGFLVASGAEPVVVRGAVVVEAVLPMAVLSALAAALGACTAIAVCVAADIGVSVQPRVFATAVALLLGVAGLATGAAALVAARTIHPSAIRSE